MAFWIDFTIIAIIAFCVWRGFKSGLVRGIFGVVALIVSLILANIVATAFSSEFEGMLKPFIDGIVDSTLTDVMDENIDFDIDLDELAELAADELDIDLADITADMATDFEAAFAALREIGLPESSAALIAEESLEALREEGAGAALWVLAEAISSQLSSSLAYIALFAIAFLLLAIIFAVIGNLIGLVFSLPGLKLVDIIAGSILGLVKGLLIVFVIASIFRYFGLLAQDIIEETSVLLFFINNNPIAGMLGI